MKPGSSGNQRQSPFTPLNAQAITKGFPVKQELPAEIVIHYTPLSSTQRGYYTSTTQKTQCNQWYQQQKKFQSPNVPIHGPSTSSFGTMSFPKHSSGNVLRFSP